jgi:hypothetical protein
MPFTEIAHIYVRDRDYTVYVSISMTTREIHVFKYSEDRQRCEYEVFPNHILAAEYLELLL